MNAVCARCGEEKGGYPLVCAKCGHRPVAEGLQIAWLLSAENLTPEQVRGVSERIKAGEVIRPTDKQLMKARRALGASFDSDPGLTSMQRVGVLLLSLTLTPLPAWVCFAWWLSTRPRAAWQALTLAVPGSVVYFGLGAWMLLN